MGSGLPRTTVMLRSPKRTTSPASSVVGLPGGQVAGDARADQHRAVGRAAVHHDQGAVGRRPGTGRGSWRATCPATAAAPGGAPAPRAALGAAADQGQALDQEGLAGVEGDPPARRRRGRPGGAADDRPVGRRRPRRRAGGAGRHRRAGGRAGRQRGATGRRSGGRVSCGPRGAPDGGRSARVPTRSPARSAGAVAGSAAARRRCRRQPHRGEVDDLARRVVGRPRRRSSATGPDVDDDAAAEVVVPAAALAAAVHHRGPGERGERRGRTSAARPAPRTRVRSSARPTPIGVPPSARTTRSPIAALPGEVPARPSTTANPSPTSSTTPSDQGDARPARRPRRRRAGSRA